MSFLADNLVKLDPYHYDKKSRDYIFISSIQEMSQHHYKNCIEYKNYCKNNNFDPSLSDFSIYELPYLPVSIFKSVNLVSSDKKASLKKLQSSATTTGTPSKIFIDYDTSKRQTQVSSSVMRSFLNDSRHDFFILDANPRSNFNSEMTARLAATQGFLIMARKHAYFMNYDSNGKLVLDIDKFIESCQFFSKDSESNTLTVFGFTFIVYQYVVKYLIEKEIKIDLSGAKLAHIGGWKKLIDSSVNPEQFKRDITKTMKISKDNIIDFYGFTEQMGLIYGEIKEGYKITPAYSEIIIRDVNTLKPVPNGEIGFIQIISPIFSSFPGISVLTEDLGRIVGEGLCSSGRKGTCFEILGRAKEAEIRGCGDLMEDKMVI